jgi:putative restriction endonuclease
MRFFVAVTDNDWFEFLRQLDPDEVNFWRPSGREFVSLEAGTPFLFKLHSPYSYIVGGGFFVRSEKLPLSMAWEVFEQKNGASNHDELEVLIRRHREPGELDPEIGCTVLNQPFFIPREHWIPVPEDWKPNIVTGRTYDDGNESGKSLWSAIQPWIPRFEPIDAPDSIPFAVQEPGCLYGREYLSRSRLGQGAFRILVTDAYQRRCAISGERTLPVLQASHIKPYGRGPIRVDNGLLLRSDLHILFDRGYMTVTPELRVEISPRIKEEYENGRDYYRLKGNPLLILPASPVDHPNREFLRWHNENVYRSR